MSRVFREIVRIRTSLYEKGRLRTWRLNHPVVSVGNLTVGGNGKTPLVMALAGGLRRLGYRPVILSRGYRRTSRGVVVVSRGQGPEVGWRDAGDEPFLMALRLPETPIVVGADRVEAGREAERCHLGDLFILDDGFQHRRLAREVDIVAIDPADWLGDERLLPAGRWREPRSALARAHAACIPRTRKAEENEGERLSLPVPTFEFTTEIDGLVRDGELVSPAALGQEPVVAFAGIARPGRFFGTLRSLGLNVVSTHRFRDHHVYRPRDLNRLPAGIRITTEKDAVRLDPGDFWFLRVSASIVEFEALLDLVTERIHRPQTKSIQAT